MNELKLQPLTCPQCGAPGVVREGTRITHCDRCGARLCLTDTAAARYEVVTGLDGSEAAGVARARLAERGQTAVLGRSELVLIPYHEIAGRRVGVFERKVPERKRVQRTVYSPQAGGEDVVSEWEYSEREDTKVMVSDVQTLSPAARAPWNLGMFDAAAARRTAVLRAFDLAEAQRRATVFAAESSPAELADRRFAGGDQAELVAVSRRTLFFPFWSVPVGTAAGNYEIVVEGVNGDIVAWRLPEAYPASSLNWGALAVPGTLALGHGLHAGLLGGAAVIDPVLAIAAGALATGAAIWRANRPDWTVRSWPEAGATPGLGR